MTERPSPHSIAICALITLQHDREDENHYNVKVDMEQRALGALIERLLTSPTAPGLDPCIHPPFSILLKSIGTNDNKISQTLTELLKSLCISVDALVDFFEYLSSSVSSYHNGSTTTNARNKAAKLVDGTSIQGIYIRQQTLGYQTLSFESVTRLWDALCRYVGGSSSTDNNTTSDTNTTNYSMELWPPSVSQMESYLQNKCLSLEYDDITPYCTTDEISELLQSYYPQVPSLHYYQYLHSIQRNERMASYEAFYRYFDYSMIQERRRMAASNTAETATTGTATTAATTGTSSILQYAPIELAALHAEFGFMDSSRMATEEGIRVAQQYHDGACVAYAMAWMPQQRHNTLADSKDFLRQCLQRASSNRLYPLASGVALSLAQQEAQHDTTNCNDGELLVVADDQGSPRKIWDALSSADTRTTDSSTTTFATVLQENSSCMVTLSILAKQTLVSSAVWEIFGNSAMSSLLSKISLDVYGNSLSGMEYALAKHKHVMGGFVGHRSALLASSEPGTPTRSPNAASISSPSFDGSVHARALWDILSLRKSRYPETPYGTSVHTMICFTTALLLHDLAVSLGKRYDIQPLTVFLNSIADGGSNVYGGIVPILQVAMQSASRLCLLHRQEEARSILQRTIRSASQHQLSNIEGRVLYQLCEMTLASDSSHPARVLPLVLECLSLAQRLSYDSLHASAIGLLARVFVSMGYWRRSIPLIRGSLPFVLAHAPLEDQGVLWLTLAKSVLLQAGDMQPPHPPSAKMGDRPVRKVVKLLNTALLQINESIVLFQKIQSTRRLKEAFYLKARLCNDLYHLKRSDVASEIDYLKERNMASNNFRSICRQEVKASCLPVRSYNLRRCLNETVEMEQLIATVL